MNPLSTKIPLDLYVQRVHELCNIVQVSGGDLFESSPNQNTSGPVCPEYTRTMQQMTEFVSIDLLTILFVRDQKGRYEAELFSSGSTLAIVHVVLIQ